MVPADGRTEKIELRMPGAFAITGVVLDPTGAPVEATKVQLWRLTEDAPEESFPFSLDTTSAEGGRFTLPLSRRGRYRVVAGPGEFVNSKWRDMEIGGAQAVAHVELQLQRPAAITGRVRGPIDVRNLRVVAGHGGRRDPHGIYWMWLYGEGHFTETRTADDGTFALRGLHPDAQYDVTVFLDEKRYLLRLDEDGVAAGSEIEFRATAEQARAATVHGQVRHLGRGMEEFQVRLWKHYDDGPSYPENAVNERDGDGSFVIPNLAVGAEYSLVVRARGLAPTYVPRFRMSELRRDVTVEMFEFGSVEISVTPAGQVVANRSVMIESLNDNPENEPKRVSTDRAGRVVAELAAGRYRASTGEATVEFEVQPGQRAFATLR